MPAGRHDLLARGLVRLARDPTERARLGAEAAQRADRYDIADAARRVEALYAEVVAAR